MATLPAEEMKFLFTMCLPEISFHGMCAVFTELGVPTTRWVPGGVSVSDQLELLSECEIGAGEVAARLRIVFPQLSTSDRRIADVLLTKLYNVAPACAGVHEER